jgi:esterase/lipase superfamily enzyme
VSTLYFATNRLSDAHSIGGFGVAPSATTSYGAAGIGADGALAVDPRVAAGGWAEPLADAIVAAGTPILVIIHGFNYSFGEAIARAASLGGLLASQGAAATMIAFCWPSQDRLIEIPNLAGAYAEDRAMAAGSATAIADFFTQLGLLRGQILRRTGQGQPAGRIGLLCHSLGAYALAEALDQARPGIVFDEAILAAADEQWNSFSLAGGRRLGQLGLVSQRQTIYFTQEDEVLHFSGTVLGQQRLGYDGPQGKADRRCFPPERFRLIDCSSCDRDTLDPNDSHQYYRKSRAIIADMAQLLTGRIAAADIAQPVAVPA